MPPPTAPAERGRGVHTVITNELSVYKIEVSPGHHHGEILKTYKWVGSLSESVKKEKFMTKIFFPDNVV